MNFECGIYGITSPSGKLYIGQTECFSRRWAEHLGDLRAGRHHCKALQSAFKKYGESGLTFFKIAIVPVHQLDIREQEQIDSRSRRMLYNSVLVVGSPMRGRKHNKESRKKISQISQKMWGDPEYRKKFSGQNNHRWGRTLNDSHRAALIASRTSAKHTPGSKKKMSEATKVRMTEEMRSRISSALKGANSPRARPVMCVDTGQIFVTSYAAAEYLRNNGKPRAVPSSISQACLGKLKSAYGFKWSHVNQENPENHTP